MLVETCIEDMINENEVYATKIERGVCTGAIDMKSSSSSRCIVFSSDMLKSPILAGAALLTPSRALARVCSACTSIPHKHTNA